jgi:hypothetical protein
MSSMLIDQICDVTTEAFCKNQPDNNKGYCVKNDGLNGVCCVFSQSVNKDCYDAAH